MNNITHNHSIVVVKDSFNKYPNRFLVYDDKRWNCELFLNYKDNPNNESFIKSHLSAELKVDSNDISLTYVSQRIHEKYSQSDKISKVYCHKFYRADIENFPDSLKNDEFECDGKVYHWRTISDLEANGDTMKKNKDIVGYIKEMF